MSQDEYDSLVAAESDLQVNYHNNLGRYFYDANALAAQYGL